jgi:hypothetical protein
VRLHAHLRFNSKKIPASINYRSPNQYLVCNNSNGRPEQSPNLCEEIQKMLSPNPRRLDDIPELANSYVIQQAVLLLVLWLSETPFDTNNPAVHEEPPFPQDKEPHDS